ncbi:MAG: carbohydrate kinase family protein [Defluviitaleaceae bacterium]|nr:carbohydrate kinase family protein [Defluviitaleaceae bacterium]
MQNLISKLENKKGFNLNMIIGCDGFVDEIIHLVDKRQDHANYTRIPTIAEYGQRISRAAGLSTNIEMVSVQTKLGGNGPILSNALIEYGVDLIYVGALGKPDIHPVFKPMAAKAKAIYSLINAAGTDALEFEDGKIMMGKHSSLNDLTWEVFKSGLGGPESIAKLINESHLFGMENWTMMAHMSEIWEGLINEVLPLLENRETKPLAFFDLADPEKRTADDLLKAVRLIGKFEGKFRAILGLNEKEIYQVAQVLGVEVKDAPDAEKLKNTVIETHKRLGIYCLMVHPVRSACCAIGDEYFTIDGPYCQKPKLTTGAGDNLNSGFCLGQALDLNPLESLTLGVATSGFYVRNAKSPTFDEVIEFIKSWDRGDV